MIEQINFNNLKKSETFFYLDKLDFFKQNETIKFEKGLNILFSPNGTGKSSILKMIALSLACEQGGYSVVTNSWRMGITTFGEKNTKMGEIEVIHDGQATLYGNPRNTVGLTAGAFDDDFFEEGIQNSISKESTGFTTMQKLRNIIKILSGESTFPENIEYKLQKKYLDKSLLDLLEAKIEKGQRTILMDEPESGLAMHVQANLFHLMNKAAKEKDIQLIVATHSPFAFATQANVIELVPGHIELSKRALKGLMNFL